MLLLRTESLPEDRGVWDYELKLDGYRAVAFKTGGALHLRSRNDNDFRERYASILPGLAKLPDETAIDGEVVAIGEDGRPSFQLLQNYASSTSRLVYYVFDVTMLRGRDLMAEPLEARRRRMEDKVLPLLAEPVRYIPPLDGALPVLVESVRAQGLEGLVAKRRDSRYEPGLRSGAWRKMRVSRGQEFVIGGYTAGTKTFDAILLGTYDGRKLMYAGRTRNGFLPAIRNELFRKFGRLQTDTCPFANLPETKKGRWGAGLTQDKMKECRWLKPVLVAHVEFVEWTSDDHLRHARFVALRDDKPARQVRRE